MLDHSTNEHIGWTDERTETLKRRWTEGASATEIARELGGGVTRNGVIGKVSRLALRAHGANPVKPKTPKVKRTPDQIAEDSRVRSTMMRKNGNAGQPKAAAIVHNLTVRKPPTEIDDEIPEGVDVGHLIGLVQLTERTCRFPVVGAGAGTLFCGNEIKPGSRYCSGHHKRVYYAI